MPGPYQPLLEFAETSLIITVNERLARRLRAEYDQGKTEAGCLAWKRPEILPCEQWLAGLAERFLPEAVFLSFAQDQVLWEMVIRDMLTRTGHSLVQIPATARRAREAHRLLQQYGVAFSLAEATPDQQAFLQWQQAYRQQLAAEGCADRAALTRQLVGAGTEVGSLHPRIVLAGFDEIKPDLQQLLDALAESGGDVSIWQPGSNRSNRRQFCHCADAEAEVRAAARWARQSVLDGVRRIGIVVPELQRYRPLFNTVFSAELDPRAAVDGRPDSLPFAISLGGSLAEEGVVAAALALLSPGEEWSLDTLSFLLRTPYLERDPAADRFRSEFEIRLRSRRQRNWSLGQLARQFQRNEKTAAGRHLLSLFELLGRWVAQKNRHAPGDWATRILELLERCGWPGTRGLSSREFQAYEKFREMLRRLASLDQVLARIDRHEALGLLQRLCHDEPFQAETPECKIEVVGLLEAGGLQFDRLWIMGLHDGLLPEPLQPNPFIPYPLQRRLGMPRAEQNHETAYCHALAGKLFDAADAVVVSCPQQDGDNPVRAHHLVRDWPDQFPGMGESHDPVALIAARKPALESCDDRRAPALHSRKPVAGGTALLKDQALCPFRAFAHHRLKATAPEPADVGLDAMMRGNLVHHLLEAFWRDCGDSATLAALTGEALAERLGRAAGQALEAFERAEKRNLPPRFRRLEQARLEQLGREWLLLEQERAPFRVLTGQLEQSRTVQFGPLQIRTRLDRLDRLESGRVAIIDYKTGRPDPLQWFDERITEPQLPVYAGQDREDELGAVLFAIVRAGDCRFRGLVEDPGLFPGLPEQRLARRMQDAECDSLTAVGRRWGDALQALAEQFCRGWAAVDPIDEIQACRYCDLTTLCRIREAAAAGDEGEG